VGKHQLFDLVEPRRGGQGDFNVEPLAIGRGQIQKNLPTD
jgi:hypothetical protein